MESAYQVAVAAWNIQPSEFRAMHPTEFWWIADYKRQQNPKMYGDLTEDQVREMYEDNYDEDGNPRHVGR